MIRALYRILRFMLRGTRSYSYDACMYLVYSATVRRTGIDRAFGRIMVLVHALEKGLSLPHPREKFGNKKLHELLDWKAYIKSLPGCNKRDFLLRQIELIEKDMISFQNKEYISPRKYSETSINPDHFLHFMRSRTSTRIWTGDMVESEAVRRAQAAAIHTPSVCNRQPAGSIIIDDKAVIGDILALQKGAVGFGDKTSLLIIIYSDLSAYWHAHERNQVWIDGGMYAQSILLGLHANNVAHCPLNMCLLPADEAKIKHLAGLPLNTRLIMAVATGVLRNSDCAVARSERYSHD